MKKVQKIKSAFTLAEILVAITILGIIAAVTLPTLNANIQKRSTITALKKSYNTLGQALKLMAVEEDADIRNSYCGLNMNSTDTDIMKTCFGRWINQFSAERQKSFSETCDSDWCKYKVAPNNLTKELNTATAGTIRTTDGITYFFINGIQGDILVDTNGTLKGPNETGKDIFRFYVDYENNRLLPGGSIDDPENEKSEIFHCDKDNFNDMCTAEVIEKDVIKYY